MSKWFGSYCSIVAVQPKKLMMAVINSNPYAKKNRANI